jgi:hypothetical protein
MALAYIGMKKHFYAVTLQLRSYLKDKVTAPVEKKSGIRP